MQPISVTSYDPRTVAKTAPCRTCGKTGRQPVRRRRRQQRGGVRLPLRQQLGKDESRYA